MRFKNPKSNDDPGGKQPEFHEGLSHRPIVTITNKKTEVVQFTLQSSFPYSQEAVIRLRTLMSQEGHKVGTNGSTRVVGQDGGLVRYPAGPVEEGTTVNAFSVVFAPKEHAGAIEQNMLGAGSKFEEAVAGARIHGLVQNANQEIMKLQMLEARQRNVFTDTITDGSTVELIHETPARDGEHGESDRDALGARATEA